MGNFSPYTYASLPYQTMNQRASWNGAFRCIGGVLEWTVKSAILECSVWPGCFEPVVYTMGDFSCFFLGFFLGFFCFLDMNY